MAPVLRPRPRPCTGHIRHRFETQRDHPTTKSTTATASGRSSRISRRRRRRRRHRNFNKSSSSPGSSVITPQPSDVLSGRGKGSYDWQGNVAYLQLLASFVPAYVATSSNKDKIHITQQIVSLIQKQGGRFLGFINNADNKNDNKKGRNTKKKNGGKLYVVSDEEARLRVSQVRRHDKMKRDERPKRCDMILCWAMSSRTIQTKWINLHFSLPTTNPPALASLLTFSLVFCFCFIYMELFSMSSRP